MRLVDSARFSAAVLSILLQPHHTDSNPSCLPQLLGQDAFQFLGREAQLEPIVDSDADAARFFGDDNGDAVALLGDA